MVGIQKCVKYFRELILDELPVNCWVAGGALRDYFIEGNCDTSKDIDVFFQNEDDFKKASLYLNKITGSDFSNGDVTNFTINQRKIQLIGLHNFKNPKETIDSFDFTICCAAVDKQTVYFSEKFLDDIKKKELIIQKLPYPIGTLKRLQRYVKKGFTMSESNLCKLALAISEIDTDDIEECFYRED